MDEPQGQLAPRFPDYVTNLNEEGEIDFRDRKVKMCNPSFLGANFKKHKDFPFAGVNLDLGHKIIAAQKNLYTLALEDKAKTLALEGKPPPEELGKDEFRKWCWLGQQGMAPGEQSARIASHSGVADRKSKNSKHTSGSAMDLHVLGNPWMPVRGLDDALGGEVHREKTKAFAGDLVKLHREKIWRPTMEIFDRAHRMFFGVRAEIHPELKVGKIEETYNRFKNLSLALERYFRYAFHTFQEKPPSERQKTFDIFKVNVLGDAAEGVIHADALHVDGNPLVPRLGGAGTDAILQPLFDQIVKDYTFMPFPLVSGTLSADADGNFSLPGQPQRDPTSGVLNIRFEVVRELVVEQKLRWGGAMFERNAGDCMHFDLGTHFIDGEPVA